MSRRGAREAAAGLAVAAAGLTWRRLTGRRKAAQPRSDGGVPPGGEQPRPNTSGEPSQAELARARSELAEELARRAGRVEP